MYLVYYWSGQVQKSYFTCDEPNVKEQNVLFSLVPCEVWRLNFKAHVENERQQKQPRARYVTANSLPNNFK